MIEYNSRIKVSDSKGFIHVMTVSTEGVILKPLCNSEIFHNFVSKNTDDSETCPKCRHIMMEKWADTLIHAQAHHAAK